MPRGRGKGLRGRAAGHGRAMRFLLILVAFAGILVVLGMYVSSRPRREPKAETQPRTPGASQADEFPDPGGASPHRPDGSPVPGSRDHRHEHGQA